MRISVTSSMIMAATALSSSVFAAPFNSTGSHSVPLDARTLLSFDSMLNGLPFVGSVFAPVTSVLDSVGLSDPSKVTNNVPLTDAQKDVIAKLQTAISDAANKIEANLPADVRVTHPVKRQAIASDFEDLFNEGSGDLEPEGIVKRDIALPLEAREISDLDSLLKASPAVGSLLAPVTSLLDSIGLNDPSRISNKIPLTDAQKNVISKLQVALSKAVGKIAANLPTNLPVKRQDVGSEFEDPSNEESGSLEPEAFYNRGSLGAREPQNLDSVLIGLPVIGPILAPVASLLDSIGLNDPSNIANNAPLTAAQKDAIAKLKAALSTAAGNVAANLPADLPKTTRTRFRS